MNNIIVGWGSFVDGEEGEVLFPVPKNDKAASASQNDALNVKATIISPLVTFWYSHLGFGYKCNLRRVGSLCVF